MFRTSSFSIGASLALVIVSLFESSHADIVGCDAVDCPLNRFNQTQCVIGITTTREIGISSFNIGLLSSQPLTWTLTTQVIQNQGTTVERDFFLGMAPPNDLQVSAFPQQIFTGTRAVF